MAISAVCSPSVPYYLANALVFILSMLLVVYLMDSHKPNPSQKAFVLAEL